MSSYTIGCIFCIGPCVNTCWEDVLTLKTEIFFFSVRVFFHRHWQLTGQQGKGGYHLLFHSTTLTHSQTFRTTLYVRWDHIFLTSTLVFTRLLLMRLTTLSNYYLVDSWCNLNFRLVACWFDFRFCYSYLTWEISGLELSSTIIIVLQVNRLTKRAIHPKVTEVFYLLELKHHDSYYSQYLEGSISSSFYYLKPELFKYF